MKKCQIIFRSLLATAVAAGMLFGPMAFAKERPEKSTDAGKADAQRLLKPGAYQPERYQILNINNLWSWAREDGLSNHSPTGDNGVFFPRGTSFIVYQDGMVFGSRAYTDAAHTQPAPYGQTIRVGGATYGTGTFEGWIDGFGASASAAAPDDPRARIYRIRRDWKQSSFNADGSYSDEIRRDAAESNEININSVTDAQIQAILDQYAKDWAEWPVDLGAPYVERNGQPGYQAPPADFTVNDLIANSYDEPGIAGADPNSPADQVLWTVYNDLNTERSVGRFGSEPTGLEIQVTIWGYKRADALGNIFFRKWRFINKGGVDTSGGGSPDGAFYLDSMYVCQWSDPDLGSFSDDLVGCDTLLSIGFVYNGNAIDTDFRKFNLPPPSGGYDFLQGPAVPSPGDRAVFDLKYKDDFKNLGMTGFSYFSAGSPYSDPRGGYDTNTIYWYKMLRGYAPLGGPDVRYNHPPGVTPGPFPLAGDPVTGSGHIDGQGADYSFVPGDRRLLVITGPFTMAPGDTQEVVVAFVAGLGADRLSSVSVMKFNDRFAQNTYDALFQVPKAPKAPEVLVSELNGKIILDWGSNIPSVLETEQKVNEPGNFKFEGYNLYTVPSPQSTKKDAKRIATWDLITDPTVVLDQTFDVTSGQVLTLPVQFGSNSGLQRYFEITKDYLRDIDKLNNGQEYYFAVTAYSKSQIDGYLPQSLESELRIITAVPKVPFGVQLAAALGDTISHTHAAGSSDGAVYPVVIRADALTGDQYEVSFSDDDGDGVTEWSLKNLTQNKVLLSGQTNQSGNDDYLFTDGFQARVVGAPLEFKRFLTVANANGPISGEEGAAADFQGYPSLRPTDNQQAGEGHWFIHTGGNRSSYSQFLDRTSNGGTRWGNIIPYDYEIRFTAGGSYAYDPFVTGKVMQVPFELWNIGINTPDDASDDYRMVPYVIDWGDDGFGYDAGTDSPVSGGSNDPVTDWVYWCTPDDKTPGDAGYKAWEAAAMTWTDPNEDHYNELAKDDNMRRMVFVNWNGADDATAASPVYNQLMPEDGTIFRIITTKPNTVNDKFTFVSPEAVVSQDLKLASAENIGVFPNPYYAFNALETNRLSRFVTFNNLPKQANIRIFNLAGQMVTRINKDSDSQFAKWDLLNSSGLPVASGMYIAHITLPELGVEKVLKIAIIQEAEVLDTF